MGKLLRFGLIAALGLLGIGIATPAPAGSTPLPTVIGTRLLGYSVQGRPIMAYHLGDPAAAVKAVLLGQIHGDEKAGPVVANAVIRGGPITGIDLWVVPTINPDGNAVGGHQNARGVDLNRNWPSNWRPLSGYNYSGTAALSEPETRAMYNFLSTVRPTLMVSIHQPLDGVDITDGGTRNPAFARRLAAGLGLPLRPFRCGSVCYGSLSSWVTRYQTGSAITVEYPAGAGGTWLTVRSPAAIVAAFGGGFDAVARHNPVLHMDVAAATGSSVTLRGWAFDPDARTSPVLVLIDEGTVRMTAIGASGARPDVNRAYRLSGGHGFTLTFAASTATHLYCVTALNISYGDLSPRQCFRAVVNGDPRGVLDAARAAAGAVTLTGWAYDPDRPAASSSVQVREGARIVGTYVTTGGRPDVNRVYGLTGTHGFTSAFPAAAGRHTYSVYAVNLGSAKARPLILLVRGTVSITV